MSVVLTTNGWTPTRHTPEADKVRVDWVVDALELLEEERQKAPMSTRVSGPRVTQVQYSEPLSLSPHTSDCPASAALPCVSSSCSRRTVSQPVPHPTLPHSHTTVVPSHLIVLLQVVGDRLGRLCLRVGKELGQVAFWRCSVATHKSQVSSQTPFVSLSSTRPHRA